MRMLSDPYTTSAMAYQPMDSSPLLSFCVCCTTHPLRIHLSCFRSSGGDFREVGIPWDFLGFSKDGLLLAGWCGDVLRGWGEVKREGGTGQREVHHGREFQHEVHLLAQFRALLVL